MHVHLIAIGGSAMHNMALALHEKGYRVTGSDDEINEPSRSRLKAAGILPPEIGWFSGKIVPGIDAVILGMHAREDNPELIRAKELGLKIYSYPEYIYEATKDKTRVVVGGSHGKTTITAMILHVLNHLGYNSDFMVGAQLAGFNTMVKLSKDASIAVIEGDEYLASPIDRRPKFHLYKPDIAILSGIAWDSINVFPTFDSYVDQFRIFINLIEPNGTLVYCAEDPTLKLVAEQEGMINRPEKIPYGVPKHRITHGTTWLITEEGDVPLLIFGNHNLMNLNGARLVCHKLGITNAQFYKAIQSFSGAARRLELVDKTDHFAFYKDFAHSPSKLKATTQAVKQQFTDRQLIACMELHTFSSLNETFLGEYKGAMNDADEAIVYFNPHTIAHKKLKPITEQQVFDYFGRQDLKVFTDSQSLQDYLRSRSLKNSVLLMMSSGNFDGIDFKVLSSQLQTS